MTTHPVPRGHGAVRELKLLAAHQEQMEEVYRQKRKTEDIAFEREMQAQAVASKHQMAELQAIAEDPLKRSEFTYQLVKEGIRRIPDRTRHPEFYKGTFLAEQAKETSLQAKAIFRKLEASLAAARQRRTK
jgi:hypothetical protein